jgi:hypothetical protein
MYLFHARTARTARHQKRTVRCAPFSSSRTPSRGRPASPQRRWPQRSCTPGLRWGRTLVLGALTPLAGFDPSTTGRFSGVHRGLGLPPIASGTCPGQKPHRAGRSRPATLGAMSLRRGLRRRGSRSPRRSGEAKTFDHLMVAWVTRVRERWQNARGPDWRRTARRVQAEAFSGARGDTNTISPGAIETRRMLRRYKDMGEALPDHHLRQPLQHPAELQACVLAKGDQ